MDIQAVTTLLSRRFIQRHDVKAIQQPDGSYRPDRTPWRRSDLVRHVQKEISYGHYLVDSDGRCKLFAFDLDFDTGGPRERWQDPQLPDDERLAMAHHVRCLAWGLAYRARRLLEIEVGVAYSGSKGCHVYGWTGEVSAEEAKGAAAMLLEESTCVSVKGSIFWKSPVYEDITIEVFPKQVKVGGGVGNLMRLPLGRNLKGAGLPHPYDKSGFLRPGDDLPWKPDHPVTALEEGSTRHHAQPWAAVS